MKKMPMCPECEKRKLQPAMTTLRGTTHGESFELVSDALVCPNCGFKTIPTENMGEFALRVADAYRLKHGLLTSSQIKDRRLDLGMSQQQFASYLGVGSSSVKRWELGSIQDKAMNDLILLKTDVQRAEANVAEVLNRLGKTGFTAALETSPYLPSFWEGSIKSIWELKDWHGPYAANPWTCTGDGLSMPNWRDQGSVDAEEQDSQSLGLVA
jgi:putative zinc finger/helix-turn-helix YgiT family protein